MIFTTSMLKSSYSKYINPLDKIKRDVDKGKLIRLTKGLYETDKTTNPIFLAGSILSPSYISYEFALSYYMLIPERVTSITSASLQNRKNKTFINGFSRFEYSDIPISVFSSGLTIIEQNGYAAKIATKEKAICDCLYKWPVCNSVKELKTLLFIDKRIDVDEFKNLDFSKLIFIASKYKRKNLNLLIKLVRKEYFHE